MGGPNGPASGHNYHDNYESFFENSPCGFVTAEGRAKILRCNGRFAEWLGYTADELVGTKFSDLLTIAGKMFYETHLAPLLRMRGAFEQAALELVSKTGERVQFLVNACEERDDNGTALFVRLALFRATDRRLLEQNLQAAKDSAESRLAQEQEKSVIREQFIAVLGHDLRNPLGAISSGTELLARTELDQRQAKVVDMMRSSANRMGELIENLMDFARARLGGGIAVNRQISDVSAVLRHTVDELRAAHPDREIRTEVSTPVMIDSDPARLSQLLSNLVANAITHGATDQAVVVAAGVGADGFELSVTNGGQAIPDKLLSVLFQPFTRKKVRPSQQGLGLGLYIASEISKAHGGKLKVDSTSDRTRFVFRMAVVG